MRPHSFAGEGVTSSKALLTLGNVTSVEAALQRLAAIGAPQPCMTAARDRRGTAAPPN